MCCFVLLGQSRLLVDRTLENPAKAGAEGATCDGRYVYIIGISQAKGQSKIHVLFLFRRVDLPVVFLCVSNKPCANEVLEPVGMALSEYM